MGICSNLDRLMASGLGRVPGCVASALPCPGLSVSWEGAWSLLLLPAPPGLLEESLGASFINGWMLQGSCNSSLCSGVGCPAVEQESKCAPVENKWGGLVVSECQLLQSFLGLIPAPELFVLLLALTSPARLSPGEAAHALRCLQAWGGCRELGDVKISFI